LLVLAYQLNNVRIYNPNILCASLSLSPTGYGNSHHAHNQGKKEGSRGNPSQQIPHNHQYKQTRAQISLALIVPCGPHVSAKDAGKSSL
jgi:hypothetical protein